jgi:succinoglycan biosynthesis protein ExoM
MDPMSRALDVAMKPEIKSNQTVVTVCICTFRRASLMHTLHSVANQVLSNDTECQIIVVDNDAARTAEPIVRSFRALISKINLEYVQAPGQNISIARNAGLKACRTRWLAFIDDDETAASDWIERLMARRHGAAAVFGPCKAIYSDETPKWIRIGDYHSHHAQPRYGVVDTGYTSNVLIDMDIIRALKVQFDESFGRTGAEDTDFFYALHRHGGHLAFAPDAFVYEVVSNARATLGWVMRRRLRVGQTFAKLQKRYRVRDYRRIHLLAPIKVAFCVGVAATLAIRPSRAMWWLMRGVFHWGMLTYRLNGNVYEEYGPSGTQKEKFNV